MRSHTTDNELEALEQLAAGDLAAFNFIYQKYSSPVFANICKYIKDPTLAEDILQEVFLILWEKRTSIKADQPVGGWLYTVSYHQAVSWLRKQIREALMKTERAYQNTDYYLPEADQEEDFQYRVRLLEEAVNCLPEKKRQVFRLSRFEHKKPEEISSELGLTVISVKHYLKQSNKMIREYVQLNYPVDLMLLFMILFNDRF